MLAVAGVGAVCVPGLCGFSCFAQSLVGLLGMVVARDWFIWILLLLVEFVRFAMLCWVACCGCLLVWLVIIYGGDVVLLWVLLVF